MPERPSSPRILRRQTAKAPPARELPPPRQLLVLKWAELIRNAEEDGTLQIAEPESGVVMFAWYYDKYGLHELGESAADLETLREYQPKLRMRESRADSARKDKMKSMASDYFFRYYMFLLERGFENRLAHPRNYTAWEIPVDLKRWIHYEVVKGYIYVDRQRLIKRLYDRLGEEAFRALTPVARAQRTNRIKVVAKDGRRAAVNITRALRQIAWEGFGFEESVEVEIERAKGAVLPRPEIHLVEIRRAIEGEEYEENEGLWEEAGPAILRPVAFDLIKAAAREREPRVEDRGSVVLFAYPLSTGSDRERRACFFDAIRYVREQHASQMRGRFYQFPPPRDPPEDLYITHVVNAWNDDPEARALVEQGKVHAVQWVDSRALAREVLEGFSRIGLQSSTGPRTAELRQRALLIAGSRRRPFEFAYGAQLIAQFGYSFEQAVDLSIIKAYLKVAGV